MIVRELVNLFKFKTDKTSLSKSENFVKKAVSGIGKIALGVSAAVAGIGIAAIKTAADFESLNAEFEVMLGSAQAAAQFTSEIRKFAAATPFQVQDLAAGARTMLAFGIAEEEVLGNLRMLGDVAGKNTESFKSLTLAFSQISSQGKLMGGDLLQLINAGFNPLTVISQKTGKSMAQLKDEMSKGQISAQMVADAFKAATSEGGRFYQNMQKQSQTLGGLFSTFLDNITLVLNEIGQKFIPTVKEGLKILTDLFQNELGEVITDLVSFFDPLLKVFLQLFQSGVKFLVPIIKLFSTDFVPVLIQIINIILRLGKTIFESFGSIVIPILKAVLAVIKVIVPVFDVLASILEIIIRLLGLLLSPILQFVAIIIETIANEVTAVLWDLAEPIQEFSLLLGDTIKLLSKIFGPILKIALLLTKAFIKLSFLGVRLFSKVFGKGLTFVIRLFRTLVKIVSSLLTPAILFLEKTFNAIINFFGTVVTGVIESVLNAINWLFSVLNKVIAVANKIPGIEIQNAEPVDTSKIIQDLTGGTTDNSRTTNVNMQNQININGNNMNTQQTKNAVKSAAQAAFQIELQKILISSGV